ncbi:MAG: hypothetical protein KBA51_09575, partial [Kiritimatiellae bacterium]|nr:hypothetical protein [Kiritimatiellia bacterium]
GRANAHNDPMQFLAEFGGIGFVLMSVAAASLLVRMLRGDYRRMYRDPLVFFTLTGAGLVCLHSLIDLPFRSPAILYAWVMGLAAVAACSNGEHETSSDLNGRNRNRAGPAMDR